MNLEIVDFEVILSKAPKTFKVHFWHVFGFPLYYNYSLADTESLVFALDGFHSSPLEIWELERITQKLPEDTQVIFKRDFKILGHDVDWEREILTLLINYEGSNDA